MDTQSQIIAKRLAAARYDASIKKLSVAFFGDDIQTYDQIVMIAAENGLSTAEFVRAILKHHLENIRI
jgi:predicted DsbA family dithiol-disulfide isomerase